MSRGRFSLPGGIIAFMITPDVNMVHQVLALVISGKSTANVALISMLRRSKKSTPMLSHRFGQLELREIKLGYEGGVDPPPQPYSITWLTSTAKNSMASPIRARRVGKTLQQALTQSALQQFRMPPVPFYSPTSSSTPSQSHPQSHGLPPSGSSTSNLSIPATTPFAVPTPLITSASLTPTDTLSPLLFRSPSEQQSSQLPQSGTSTPRLVGFHHAPPAGSHSILVAQALNRQNSHATMLRDPGGPLQYLNWSTERQQAFEYRLARLTVAAGLPLSWVENLELILLIEELAPAARVLSRKVLTNRIIPDLVGHLHTVNKRSVDGGFATLQADGWTGGNYHHLIAFMITVLTQLFTVKVADETTQRKTAEKFLELLEKVYHEVEKEWNITIVAIVTDASGETRKARREFVKKYPSVVVLDCYAHQINLVVGDYFKHGCDFLEYTDMAESLITWIRSKTMLLGLIQEEQIRQNKRPTTIIRPVLTHWTAHLRAYERLLDTEGVLTAVVATEMGKADADRLFVTGSGKSKEKVISMINIIRNPIFWLNLQIVTRHLRPLGAAAGAVQAAFCCLDTVLLTFGYLVHTNTNMMETYAEDQTACTEIIKSLELRWSKADQEPFIASLILNPLYQLIPFSETAGLHPAKALGLMKHLYRRFFDADPPVAFSMDIMNYLERRNNFATLPDMIELEIGYAAIHGAPEPVFFTFARRVLSINVNSALCERLFSHFGDTLTKLRNRLGNNTLTNLSELGLNIHDEHLRVKAARERLTNRFRDQVPPSADGPLAPLHPPSANLPPTQLPVSIINTNVIKVDLIDAHCDLIILDADTATRTETAVLDWEEYVGKFDVEEERFNVDWDEYNWMDVIKRIRRNGFAV
ncbi:hypothetical protein D9756_008505 [Leucocoprinus leucothites]|uniref:DUF659 domain-containing protein n=1 Tax=Leucocoprinus leucothites TaxID=201217 RepID=A0A8H5CZC9_9AGAR|nr:hypothetical protein D9756_008505 [Leucoagaricus leucothites]